MPYDSNGNATVTRNRAVTGQTVQAAQVNVPFDDVQSMLSQVLLRSGVAPMTGPINMNNFKLTNVGEGVLDSDVATISQIGYSSAGFISPGFNLSNNQSDPNNDIDFPSGKVASEESSSLIMNHGAGTSQLDVAFGSGNGGRFDASISDGWWHCFVVSNGDSVSRGFSKSLNPTSQSNYPSGYSYYRRVGSILRASNAILAFKQREDHFDLASPIENRNSAGSQSLILLSVSTPAGLVTQPKLTLTQQQNTQGNVQTRISSAGESPMSFLITTQPSEAATTFVNGGIFTDTSSRIQFETVFFSGSLLLNVISTKGWIDNRGKS
jgi:hypothetical protein